MLKRNTKNTLQLKSKSNKCNYRDVSNTLSPNSQINKVVVRSPKMTLQRRQFDLLSVWGVQPYQTQGNFTSGRAVRASVAFSSHTMYDSLMLQTSDALRASFLSKDKAKVLFALDKMSSSCLKEENTSTAFHETVSSKNVPLPLPRDKQRTFSHVVLLQVCWRIMWCFFFFPCKCFTGVFGHLVFCNLQWNDLFICLKWQFFARLFCSPIGRLVQRCKKHG